MLLERIYDEDLAQASYFVGCQAKGEAIVIDPRRDLGPYLDLAARNGMRIVAVTETHIHADYLSGTRELAAATGATAYVSAEGGDDWQYGFEAERLHHGDAIRLGNIIVEADIKGFFDNVNHDWLMKFLGNDIEDKNFLVCHLQALNEQGRPHEPPSFDEKRSVNVVIGGFLGNLHVMNM